MERIPLITAAVLAVAALVAGCGSSVDRNLSDRKARAQVYEYLRRTLDALPKGVTLSLKADVDRPSLPLGTTVSCSEDSTSGSTPADFSAAYWVNGIPNGKQAEYVDHMVRLWKSWGWTKRNQSDPEQSVFDSPDGYSLDVNNADNGPGGVSISGTSPCFPGKGVDAADQRLTDEQPSTFKQR